MSALLTSLRTRPALWLLVGAGLLLVVLANAHLVYVAVTSQPDCVTHLRAGERAADPGQFRAAKSSCSPR
ncbi:hypothetical protein FHP25_00710 [Vineibacter terrae]|uniref:Uncharacterized protein n=1 Tax=Vineibacter terrae TaxID=2586908 RepID=A0A5C8PWA8_9HYPH|nr:hypothetical protein [Vineibacter terrae]TXL82253.1 hypothetical protein FHP25_00710 [Vineibacter terrae]